MVHRRRALLYRTDGDVSEYTYLEYIQSTGSQYIDSGINCTSDLKVEMDMAYDVTTGQQMQHGAYAYNTRYHFGYDWTRKFRIYLDGDSTGNPVVGPTADRMVWVASHTYIAIGDTNQVASYSTNYPDKYTFYICARNMEGVANNCCQCKVYSCRMWAGDTLVRDYIPAKRNADGMIGLYDRVENVFYTDMNGGNFEGA
jgi:hypothetical protein